MMEKKSDTRVLRPSKTIVLDWYDGIVNAVIQFRDDENWYLINLIAWDINEPKKIYSLHELKPADHAKILSFLKDQKPSWPIWTLDIMENDDFEILEKFLLEIRKDSPKLQVFSISDLSEGISDLRETSKREFPNGIDKIMSLSRKELDYWYSLFR